jgi:polyisoprenyl-teichoic acid--peptidoglycan teichoic acid transferase
MNPGLTDEQRKVKNSLFRRVSRMIPSKKDSKKRRVALFLALLIISASAYLIYSVTSTIYLYATNFSAADLFYSIAGNLQEDDKNRTNILILGAGGGDHDGPDLTDTMIIASLHNKNNTISMLSIPRDLWLSIPGYGSSRINKIYENLKPVYGSDKALLIFKQGMENMTNLDIPYFVKVDFKAFKEVVDILGGIEIDVPKQILDTAYPKEDESGYETFTISEGLQTLDGTTALKYARSRHSTSDFDRSARQQVIIQAIKNKAIEEKIYSSPIAIKRMYEQFRENVETNLKITELISLARKAKDFETADIITQVIKDQDIVETGSFLYTPPREEYGGAFVLIPKGESFTELQLFIQVLFDHPNFFKENATIQILNGTKNSGIATKLYNRLLPFGFQIEDVGNATVKGYETTEIIINKPQNSQVTTDVLKLFLPFAIEGRQDPTATTLPSEEVTIILGEDYFETLDWAKESFL